ncbi:P4Hc domain-containing protein [Mycena indigotica]|uniref:P4Hc domain-containing protein n=1 Tax=Mycena indigotica TaxID=2126181 RepID=A0A8H6W473_9AGAR|nr:P4Hc domain-containing protein [Mycena indigotica]KAF7298674.1 P4Hc domain-containing protein [Mycena indigotica]
MSPTVTPIDFSATPLADSYTGFYAVVLDNVFSADECGMLLGAAQTAGTWAPAGMMAHADKETVHSNFRHSEQIVLVDKSVAAGVFERVRELVSELGLLEPQGKWGGIVGKAKKTKEKQNSGEERPPRKFEVKTQKASWRLVGMHPRLSFLRYGPGHYFKPHCDGLNELTEGVSVPQKSFVTIHLYLNGLDDSPDPLVGGATRFWTPDKKHFIDVEPRVGRVLVFQQRMLVHSGEEVVSGVKYSMRGDLMYEKTE